MIIFYIGRDNGAYVRLSANGVVVDLNTINKLEIKVGERSFNTIDDPSIIKRDGDKYDISLGGSGVAPGFYGMQIVAYSTDNLQGLVWGAPVNISVRA